MKDQRKTLTAKECLPKASVSTGALNFQQAATLTHKVPCMAYLILPATQHISES